MRDSIAMLVVAAAVTGCQAHPSTPSGSATVRANYQLMADCFYLKVRGDGYWQKEDLPSMNTSQVTLGTENMAVGRVEFVGVGADETRVDVLFPVPVQGKDYYPNRFLPIARGCAGG
jgi:hypothetical protein